jgi:hypothetical protein
MDSYRLNTASHLQTQKPALQTTAEQLITNSLYNMPERSHTVIKELISAK